MHRQAKVCVETEGMIACKAFVFGFSFCEIQSDGLYSQIYFPFVPWKEEGTLSSKVLNSTPFWVFSPHLIGLSYVCLHSFSFPTLALALLPPAHCPWHMHIC